MESIHRCSLKGFVCEMVLARSQSVRVDANDDDYGFTLNYSPREGRVGDGNRVKYWHMQWGLKRSSKTIWICGRGQICTIAAMRQTKLIWESFEKSTTCHVRVHLSVINRLELHHAHRHRSSLQKYRDLIRRLDQDSGYAEKRHSFGLVDCTGKVRNEIHSVWLRRVGYTYCHTSSKSPVSNRVMSTCQWRDG